MVSDSSVVGAAGGTDYRHLVGGALAYAEHFERVLDLDLCVPTAPGALPGQSTRHVIALVQATPLIEPV